MSLQKRIPSLDGIRAVAVLLVFQSHAFLVFMDTGENAATLLRLYKISEALGALGVTAFFFLSGFLITTLMRNEFEITGRVSISRFYLRRVYRLAPPFYIVLFVVFLLSRLGAFDAAMSFKQLVAQALQTTNYYLILFDYNAFRAQGLGVMWSLAVEEHFYLLFPLMFIPLLKKLLYSKIAIILFVACLVILAWRWVGYFELGFSRPWLTFATDSRADSILAGCLMGVWRNPTKDGRSINQPILGGAVVLVCFLVVCAVPLADMAGLQYVIAYSFQSICLFILFTYAIQHPEWWCFRWLNLRPLMALGTISYTFYLCHLVFIKLVQSNTSLAGFGVVLAALMLALAFSTIMYWAVERHMARLRRRLHPER